MSTVNALNKKLDPSTGVPLYRQIKEILRAEISSGAVDASTPITEALLLERFKVSRAPIRQALKELSDEGFVYRKQGKGTFPVPGRRIDRSADTRAGTLFQQLTAQGLDTSTTVAQLERIIPPSHVQKRLELEPTETVLHFVRSILVDNIPLTYSSIYLRTPAEFMPAIEELESGISAFELLERDYGIKLEQSDNEAWATAATAQQAEQLQVAAGNPLLAIETVFITKGGVPTGFRFAIHRSEEFKYHFTTTSQGI